MPLNTLLMSSADVTLRGGLEGREGEVRGAQVAGMSLVKVFQGMSREQRGRDGRSKEVTKT